MIYILDSNACIRYLNTPDSSGREDVLLATSR